MSLKCAPNAITGVGNLGEHREMTINELNRIAATKDPVATIRARRWGDDTVRGSWGYHRARFLAFFTALAAGRVDSTARTPFAIFGAGNKKLPWRTFSTLPGIDCPGAGACRRWCYSFKAWRYPAAFLRQLQCSLLMRSETGRILIARDWMKIKPGVVRLYVDGDFANTDTLRWWMEQCRRRPDLAVYGYSKSWECFLELDAEPGFVWPRNYKVNLSGGSRYVGTDVETRFAALPCVRGAFIALGEATTPQEIRETLRATTGSQKVFACPGTCGDCMPDGEHACGSERMQDVHIGIGIH